MFEAFESVLTNHVKSPSDNVSLVAFARQTIQHKFYARGVEGNAVKEWENNGLYRFQVVGY